MKAAANAVAILAWGSLLAAVWCGYALPEATRPALGSLLALVVVSLLAGTVVPAYLLGLDRQGGRSGRDGRSD